MKYIITLLAIIICATTNAQVKGQQFPNLSGHTLEGSSIAIPLNGIKKFTIIGLCYKRSAEDDLKTWIQPMYEIFVAKANENNFGDVANYYDVNYFFIPLISGFKKAANDFKDATQKELWKNVIDCDTDIKTLKAQLKPSDESIPYFYVIDTKGKIVEVVSGKYSEASMDKIEEAID